MSTGGSGSGSGPGPGTMVQSLPPPRPKSPPDLYGRRREMVRLQVLEREKSLLEAATLPGLLQTSVCSSAACTAHLLPDWCTGCLIEIEKLASLAIYGSGSGMFSLYVVYSQLNALCSWFKIMGNLLALFSSPDVTAARASPVRYQSGAVRAAILAPASVPRTHAVVASVAEAAQTAAVVVSAQTAAVVVSAQTAAVAEAAKIAAVAEAARTAAVVVEIVAVV
ncbi:hypothetical protein SOVF_018050 [Spinacia oleracea]|nr:hypothetical protein SOVF_018050 [Spinacia oleracea]